MLCVQYLGLRTRLAMGPRAKLFCNYFETGPRPKFSSHTPKVQTLSSPTRSLRSQGRWTKIGQRCTCISHPIVWDAPHFNLCIGRNIGCACNKRIAQRRRPKDCRHWTGVHASQEGYSLETRHRFDGGKRDFDNRIRIGEAENATHLIERDRLLYAHDVVVEVGALSEIE